MKTAKINEDNILTILTGGSFLLLAVLIVGGLVFGSVRFALSSLAGGLLAVANFYWLRNILMRSLRLRPDQAPRFALVRYMVRLALIAIAGYLLLVYCKADVFGLLLGLSILVINVIALSFYMMFAKGD